jgi:hypothetical protein
LYSPLGSGEVDIIPSDRVLFTVEKTMFDYQDQEKKKVRTPKTGLSLRFE